MGSERPDSAGRAQQDGITRAWEERGWPPELLREARSLHVPSSELERWLHWGTSPEGIRLRLDWADKLLNGNIRFRQLTVTDDDQFRELWVNSPEQIGEWDVTVERGPNAFAQFELQERPVLNGLFDGPTLVACVSFSLRRTIVKGQWLTVRYGQSMRVHKDHRRHGYANWVRSLPWAIGLERITEVQYDYIRGRNMEMERWNRSHMPTVDSVPKRDDDVPGIPVSVSQFTASAAARDASGVRKATIADLDKCVKMINGTHAMRDLFRPYTSEFLFERLETWSAQRGVSPRAAYTWSDFYVLERGGEVVACAGLWDRGRDTSERWQHRETGAERVTSAACLLDIGHAVQQEDALAELIEHLIGVTHDLGRDSLVAPLEALPRIAALLSSRESVPETRYMQWRTDHPPLATPAHLDLVYW